MGDPSRTPDPDWWDEVDVGSKAKAERPRCRPRIFGALTDPHTYGTMLYMLLSLATGVTYFFWVVVGLSVSMALVVVLVGIPLLMLFLISVRLLGVLEGWLVEGLLGVRMPGGDESTLDLADGQGLLATFADPRTWSTLAYLVAMLPLGIVYFVVIVVGITVPLALTGGALIDLALGSALIPLRFGADAPPLLDALEARRDDPTTLLLLALFGLVALVVMLHVIRGIGYLHGRFARALLVRE